MWSMIEKATQDAQVSVSLIDLQRYIEQTILMIDQSSNTVAIIGIIC